MLKSDKDILNLLSENEIDSLFDLNKFRKFKNNHYDKKENCEKNASKWRMNYITNPKFKTFDHKNYQFLSIFC